VVLGCYALFVKAQAESLLKDVTALTVGSSTESDVEQLTRKHSRYAVSRESGDDVVTTTFKVQNRWLSGLRLEPAALFGASLGIKSGHVYHIRAWLMRSMDIYPTFQASAGMVDEYAEYLQYLAHNGNLSAAGCDWSIVGDQCRADRQSSVAVMEGKDSKPARFGVS